MAYLPAILEELASLGLSPAPTSSAALVKDQVSDLYCYELRRLRDRLHAGAFPKHEYAARVLEVRKRYFLLSVPTARWTAPDGHDGA